MRSWNNILFVHSSVDGNWVVSPFGYCKRCFAVNTHVQVSVWAPVFPFSWVYIPRVELLGCMVTVCASVWEIAYSAILHSHQQFLHILVNTFLAFECLYLLVSEPSLWVYLLGTTMLWDLACHTSLYIAISWVYIFILITQCLKLQAQGAARASKVP